MIYVNNAELEKIFGSSSNITFSTVQVEIFQFTALLSSRTIEVNINSLKNCVCRKFRVGLTMAGVKLPARPLPLESGFLNLVLIVAK